MEKKADYDRKTSERVYSVLLEGMTFRAFHGCREDEKLNGNTFSVDFSGKFVSAAGKTDCLEDTVNYGKVYELVASVMDGERCNLLEVLASRIMEEVRAAFPQFLHIKVSVGKKNPPVAGPCEWSRITTEWNRDE